MYVFCTQDAQDVYLEQQREQALARRIMIIQKVVRGWHVRRRFLRIKKSSLTIQSTWRGYAQRKRYRLVRMLLLFYLSRHKHMVLLGVTFSAMTVLISCA